LNKEFQYLMESQGPMNLKKNESVYD
jgi:hypothetical protein